MTTLTITRADNEILAVLNGSVIYNKMTNNNPLLNDRVNLDPFLACGLNHLVLVGINWSGPANFVGTVNASGRDIPFEFSAPTTGQGMVFTQTFVIPK